MAGVVSEQPRGVAILGSTGSIGRQALEVLAWHPQRFRPVVLAAGSSSTLFREQVQRLRPPMAVLSAASDREWLPGGTELATGPDALREAAVRPDVDLVVVATSGVVSLGPTLAALAAGKIVAVANKEVLVTAGHLVMAAARKPGAALLPIDSEHCAIWQCLRGEAAEPRFDTVRRIILTASGGPFRDWPAERLAKVRPSDALRHPNWVMGPKITVDSATLMNKGLEVLEAAWLFQRSLDEIEIVVHRESVIHSMVEFFDRSIKAQLGTPDMRIPIQYALAYPDRLPAPTESLDLLKLGRLSFEPVDHARFPCVGLAYRAGGLGGSFPAVLNAANEEAVRLFLTELLPFQRIPVVIEATLAAHVPVRLPGLEELAEVDAWARRQVREKALRNSVDGMISGISRFEQL
jgi:1-deoxy-D-xylulose-5-phosphate reductoisomerase